MLTAHHAFAVVFTEGNEIYIIGEGPQAVLSVIDANEIFHVR
jgi:hypothetical protein